MEKSNLNPTLRQAQAALKKYWYVPGLLILLAILFLAGSWYGKTVAEQKTAGGRRILHYVDPMNPVRYVHPEAQAEPGVSKTQAAAKNATDPACGLEVAKEAAKQAGRTSEYQGKMYYFDTDGCKQRFDHDPQRYLSGDSGATPVTLQPYPKVPLESDVQLRYKRSLMRLAPQDPTPTAPPGATPATPTGPVQVKPPEQQTPPPQSQALQTPPPQPASPVCPPSPEGHRHD